MGSNVQVCWEKFCRYWQVEPRYVPMVPGRLHLRGAEAAAKCDENTIGVVAILGSTMDGSYEPVLEISRGPGPAAGRAGATTSRCTWTGRPAGSSPRSCSRTWSGTSGSPRVASINASGHKYGLVYPGVGWVIGGPRTPCPRTSSSGSTTWAARCRRSLSTSPGPAPRSPPSTTTSSGSAARATSACSRPARTSRCTCPARSRRSARSSCSPRAGPAGVRVQAARRRH